MLNFRFFVGNKITNYIYIVFKHFSKKYQEKNREWEEDRGGGVGGWRETSIHHMQRGFFRFFLSFCALPTTTILIHSTPRVLAKATGGGGWGGGGTGRLGELNK